MKEDKSQPNDFDEKERKQSRDSVFDHNNINTVFNNELKIKDKRTTAKIKKRRHKTSSYLSMTPGNKTFHWKVEYRHALGDTVYSERKHPECNTNKLRENVLAMDALRSTSAQSPDCVENVVESTVAEMPIVHTLLLHTSTSSDNYCPSKKSKGDYEVRGQECQDVSEDFIDRQDVMDVYQNNKGQPVSGKAKAPGNQSKVLDTSKKKGYQVANLELKQYHSWNSGPFEGSTINDWQMATQSVLVLLNNTAENSEQIELSNTIQTSITPHNFQVNIQTVLEQRIGFQTYQPTTNTEIFLIRACKKKQVSAIYEEQSLSEKIDIMDHLEYFDASTVEHVPINEQTQNNRVDKPKYKVSIDVLPYPKLITRQHSWGIKEHQVWNGSSEDSNLVDPHRYTYIGKMKSDDKTEILSPNYTVITERERQDSGNLYQSSVSGDRKLLLTDGKQCDRNLKASKKIGKIFRTPQIYISTHSIVWPNKGKGNLATNKQTTPQHSRCSGVTPIATDTERLSESPNQEEINSLDKNVNMIKRSSLNLLYQSSGDFTGHSSFSRELNQHIEEEPKNDEMELNMKGGIVEPTNKKVKCDILENSINLNKKQEQLGALETTGIFIKNNESSIAAAQPSGESVRKNVKNVTVERQAMVLILEDKPRLASSSRKYGDRDQIEVAQNNFDQIAKLHTESVPEIYMYVGTFSDDTCSRDLSERFTILYEPEQETVSGLQNYSVESIIDKSISHSDQKLESYKVQVRGTRCYVRPSTFAAAIVISERKMLLDVSQHEICCHSTRSSPMDSDYSSQGRGACQSAVQTISPPITRYPSRIKVEKEQAFRPRPVAICCYHSILQPYLTLLMSSTLEFQTLLNPLSYKHTTMCKTLSRDTPSKAEKPVKDRLKCTNSSSQSDYIPFTQSGVTGIHNMLEQMHNFVCTSLRRDTCRSRCTHGEATSELAEDPLLDEDCGEAGEMMELSGDVSSVQGKHTPGICSCSLQCQRHLCYQHAICCGARLGTQVDSCAMQVEMKQKRQASQTEHGLEI